MFWNDWKPSQQATPAAASRPKRSGASDGDDQRPPQHDAEQQDEQAGAEQPELLARDGEDEVGVLLRDEAGLGLRPAEDALPEDSAVADRDARLLGVVAGTAWVELRVGEGHEAVDLVLLQHPELDDRRGRDDSAAEQADQPSTRRTGDRDDAEDGGGQHQHGAQVGLEQDQQSREGGNPEHPDDVDVRRPGAVDPSVRSATTSAMPTITASLANSAGWMDMPARAGSTTATR